ncbi:MAG: hypothetical protein KAS72_03835 [Phycisphaerales bacterium]|nr:hypothetical protein [Phycisphaerales bacterium]
MTHSKRISHAHLPILAAGCLAVLAAASAASADTSPDGDVLIERYDFPAKDFHPQGPTGDPQGCGLRGDVTTHFMITGDPPEGDTPVAAGFTTDGSLIIAAHRDSQNLILFDANTRDFVREIALSGSPQDMAVSSDGIHVVTANIFENTASIVDLTTGTEVAVIVVGDTPGVVRITPDGATAVVGNTVDGDLSIIDIATATELRRVAGIDFVASMTFAPETGAVTVSYNAFEMAGNTTAVHGDYYDNEIEIFDIVAGTVTTIPSDDHARHVAISADGTKAVVSHTYGPQTISVVDVPSRTISKTIAIGADLYGPITMDPLGNKAVVSIQNACRVVDLTTDAVSSSLSTASVYGLLTTADGNYALGVGYYGSLISYSSESIVANVNNTVSTPVGAISPVGTRAALFSNVFGEDMVVVNTNGAAGHREFYGRSGPPPEGDKCRTAAVSVDGSTIVAVNIFSDTATVIDVATQTINGFGATGERPAEVAITPDGAKAVVANLDSYFATVIDMTTFADTTISIGRRASQVEISPDGQYAYIAVVADGDGVYRIDLNTLSLAGSKLITGNMGGIGYYYSQTSGMTLSHDGLTLIVCGSFDDTISIIDTVTWSVVKTLTVGDFPVRAMFSADDSLVYVSNKYDDTISVVSNAGAGSVVTATIAVGDQPFDMQLAPDGLTLYVFNYGDQAIGVVDTATSTQTGTIGLPNYGSGMYLDPLGETLYVATGTSTATFGGSVGFVMTHEGELNIIDTATSTIIEQIDTTVSPAMLVFNATGTVGAIPSPTPDGITLITIAPDCLGDLDGDGDTDQSDLGLLLASYEIDGGGDLDGDGDTDQSDLGILLADYGCGT